MYLLKRAILVLGLVSCVLFVSLSRTQAQVLDFKPRASVSVDIRENEANGETKVVIGVRGAIPNEFYTVWIRLREPQLNSPGPHHGN